MRQSTALTGNPHDCVHIGDRESFDIFELFSLADELGTKFLVRTCVDRLAGDGTTMVAEMKDADLSGPHASRSTSTGELATAVPNCAFTGWWFAPERQVEELSSAGSNRIHATETKHPAGRERIAWELLTDLPVRSCLMQSRSWNGMRSDGRSRPSTRSSSPAAKPKKPNCEPPNDS